MKIFLTVVISSLFLLPLLSNAASVSMTNVTDQKVLVLNPAKTILKRIGKDDSVTVNAKAFREFTVVWVHKNKKVGGFITCKFPKNTTGVKFFGKCDLDKSVNKCMNSKKIICMFLRSN